MKLRRTQHLATLESLLPTTKTPAGGLHFLYVGRLPRFLWIQELAEKPFSLISDCGFPPLTRTEDSVGSWRDVKDRRRGRKNCTVGTWQTLPVCSCPQQLNTESMKAPFPQRLPTSARRSSCLPLQCFRVISLS